MKGLVKGVFTVTKDWPNDKFRLLKGLSGKREELGKELGRSAALVIVCYDILNRHLTQLG